MQYILCEDSGSGFLFFQCIRDIYSSKTECDVITSYGNTNYRDCLENLKTVLKDGDTLILAFDSVEVEKNFNPRNIINSAQYFCEKNNIHLYYTTYYCFEELFLSYKYLTGMFYDGNYNKNDKEIWGKILQYICDSIYAMEDYYNKNDELVKYVISIIPKADKTKEKFTKAIMTHISGSICGDFKIYDGKFGGCWARSCDSIVMNNKVYRCSTCNSRFKGKNSKEKINELESNSISVLSESVSNILSNGN